MLAPDARSGRLLGGGVCALAVLLGGCTSWKDRFLRSSVVQARQYTLQGLDAADRGDDGLATELLAKAVETCPESGDAKRQYAEALWRHGRRSEAIAQLEQAAATRADDVDLLLRLGEMHLAAGHVAAAQRCAVRCRQLDRGRAEAWRLEGDVLVGEKRPDEALARYHRALAIRTHYPEVQLAVAKIYLAQGRPQRALATAESLAAGLMPDSEPVDLYIVRGLAYRALGRPTRAAEEFQWALRRGGPNPEVEVLLAESLDSSGDRVNAELVLRGTVTRSPEFVAARTMLDRLTETAPDGPGGAVLR